MRFLETHPLPSRARVLAPPPASRDMARIVLPERPGGDQPFETAIYDQFMQYLRGVAHSRMEIRILSAIHYAADGMRHGDALIAKTLVDLGLRAPRQAFPAALLDFIDRASLRPGIVPASSVLALKGHWARIGDDV